MLRRFDDAIRLAGKVTRVRYVRIMLPALALLLAGSNLVPSRVAFGSPAPMITTATASAPVFVQSRSPIRRIDFFNSIFPGYCFGETRRNVRVRNGEYVSPGDHNGYLTVRSITYGDLNGDGQEEAVVLASCNGGGSGNFSDGFIYTLRGGRRVLLANLGEGDRADGGVARVRIRDGLLHVGRFGGNAGACCPEYVETQAFRLNGRRLDAVGQPSRESYDMNNSNPQNSPERINFARGRTDATVTGEANLVRDFVVRARAGQNMTVRLYSADPNENNMLLTIMSPGEDPDSMPASTRNLGGSSRSMQLRREGDYSISLRSLNGAGNFRLTVSIN